MAGEERIPAFAGMTHSYSSEGVGSANCELRAASCEDYFSLLRLGTGFLSERGIESPQVSSERLLEKASGKSKMTALLEGSPRLALSEREAFFVLLEKRSEHYPLQYLCGSVDFRSLKLAVDPGVLIPRPETELLIDEVHRLYSSEKAFRALDIGTGSGNIALSIAQEFPRAEVTALDISPAALRLARQNAGTNGLGSRVRFLASDLLQALPKGEDFELILSNPPYVDWSEKETLQPELRFEPELALFADGEGLAVIHRLLGEAWERLVSGGVLILECGASQAGRISQYAIRVGFDTLSVRQDLAGIERIVTLRKK